MSYERIGNKSIMRILVVGRDNYYIYQRALYDAFNSLPDVSADIFSTKIYYSYRSEIEHFFVRIQDHLNLGPIIRRLNKDLYELLQQKRYDVVFIYGCCEIYPVTVRKIKKMGMKVFSYQNDDIFSDYYPWYYWRYAKKICAYVDINYVYRKKNITDLSRMNIRNAKLFRSYYISKNNYICEKYELLSDTPEVICLAHYENDCRIEYLEELCKNQIQVGVPAGLAEHLDAKYSDYVKVIQNTMAPDYNRLLSSCKIPIIFLSTLNHDTYTRRCFEIPAAGAIIFCQYTYDMNSLFEEDKEAVYFRDKKEFIEKIKYFLEHDQERKNIARAGTDKLMSTGHEVRDRAQAVYEDYVELSRRI